MFSVSDGDGGTIGNTTFEITINPINDPPMLATNTGITLHEGGTQRIGNAALRVTDIDQPAQTLTYTIQTSVIHGTLALAGLTLGVGRTFTQGDIDVGSLNYIHDGSEVGLDSFVFSVADGNGGTIGNTTFDITINPINDPPVLATNAGITLDEGGTQGIGNAALRVTDVDVPAQTLTYTIQTNVSHGTLQLVAFGTLGVGDSFTQAQIDDDLLSYTHDGSEGRPDSFVFSVSDGDGGTIGNTTFEITINPTNDLPMLATNTGITLDEGGTQGIGNAALRVNDVDVPAQTLTYTVQTNVSHGTLQLAGFGTLGVGDSFTQAQIDANDLRYIHDGSEEGLDSFVFSVSDGNGGTIGNTTFEITINPINDPPANTVPGPQVTPENMVLVFSAAKGNGLSIVDLDAGGAAVQVELIVNRGTLTLARTTGLTFQTGDGTADPSMRFTGAIAQVNAALDGLRYDPQTGFTGSDVPDNHDQRRRQQRPGGRAERHRHGCHLGSGVGGRQRGGRMRRGLLGGRPVLTRSDCIGQCESRSRQDHVRRGSRRKHHHAHRRRVADRRRPDDHRPRGGTIDDQRQPCEPCFLCLRRKLDGDKYRDDQRTVADRWANSKFGARWGIHNVEDLTVEDCALANNSAAQAGGGIYNEDYATLTVTNSTLVNNAADWGGGIYNQYGKLTVANSTLENNSARSVNGGGIFSDGTLTVTNSRLENNWAADMGGGICSYSQGTVTVANSTLANNSANHSGGGILACAR